MNIDKDYLEFYKISSELLIFYSYDRNSVWKK